MSTVQFAVNDKPVSAEVEDRQLLVEVLRDTLGLTGTHVGCDTSQCGACTVLVDGQPVKSCTMLAVQADGTAGRHRRGHGQRGRAHPIQQAFVDCHGLQCGFCTPGMIMATAALLAENPSPTDDQIVHALEGNLCRCTGYVNIVEAVRQARPRRPAGRRPHADPSGGHHVSTDADVRPLRQRPLGPPHRGPGAGHRPRPLRRRRHASKARRTWCSCARRTRTRGSSRSTPPRRWRCPASSRC